MEGADDDVPVRDASTVVLLRDGTDGIEVWLMTRVVGMAFAAGMSVFPGGRVDDDDANLPMGDADIPAMAQRFGCADSEMRSLLGAAVRETFEETGVLLTIPPAPDLSAARADVEEGRVAFGDLLRANSLTVDTGALRPWARWVTPKGEVSRRYDTRFFVGALPETAQAQDVTSESSEAEWVRIDVAMDQTQRGERLLLPPTLLTLAAMVDCATVADVMLLSESNSLEAILPNIVIGDDMSVAVELPDGQIIPFRVGPS